MIVFSLQWKLSVILSNSSLFPVPNSFLSPVPSDLLVEDSGADDHLSDHIGVTVGRRTTVLQIALALFAHLPGDTDTGSTVCYAGRETVDGTRLVKTRQAASVVSASSRVVHSDMFAVVDWQTLDGLVDVSGKISRCYISRVKPL